MNRKVAKNAGWIIGARVLQMFLGLFITGWTSRFLGPGNLGLISYVGAYVSFATGIASLGFNNIIIKELFDHSDKEEAVLGTAIIMRLVSSVLCSLLIIGLLALLNPEEPLIIVIAALLSLTLIFQSFESFNFWYQSKLQSKYSSIIQTIAYVIVAAYRLYILSASKDVRWFALGNSLDTIVIAVLLYFTFKLKNKKNLGFELSLGKEMLSRSYHFIYSGLMISIYGEMDRIMLKSMLNETMVGYYEVAVSVNTYWSFIIAAVIDSFYPVIIEAKKNEPRDVYHYRIRELYCLVIWLCTLAAIAIMILAKPIILIIHGNQYIPSIMCLRFATWINLFAYLGVARNAWMVSENRQSIYKYIFTIGAITNVILNWLLIPRFDIIGATIATIFTEFVIAVVAPALFRETRENTMLILHSLNPKILFGMIQELRKDKGEAR